jgi:hypothetical protein
VGAIVDVDPAQGCRLAGCHRIDLRWDRRDFIFRGEIRSQPMKPRVVKPKVAKVTAPVVEFRIWCDRCSIRIAPNEERTLVEDKAYHPNCYSKLNLTLSATTKD